MLRHKYAALLYDRGLSVLSIALYLCKPKEYTQLQELIKKICDIDICDPNVDFTDEQITKLKDFEKVYNQVLLGIILGNDMEDPFHVQLINREMDLKEQSAQQSSRNFNFTCWYGACLTLLGFMYLFMVTWIPIPPEHMRFADTGLGAIIGSLIQTITNYFFQLREQQKKLHDQQNLADKLNEDKNECD